MFYVYYDSGTTNTRIYLIKDGSVADYVKKSVGSRDTSISGSNKALMEGLLQLYNGLLEKNGISDDDIQGIYASGMATSPFGIREVPHLTTPLSDKKLLEGIFTYFEPCYFKREIKLIRGVKTIPDGFKVDRYNVFDINNTRGEEIEVFGIIPRIGDMDRNDAVAIFLPGSHTHIAYVKGEEIIDILSTFSGELFKAVSSTTILSSSIQEDINHCLDEEMLFQGFRMIKEYGINRALYIVNTMKIFSSMSNFEKTSYLEGVITGGIVLAFEKIRREKWTDTGKVIIAAAKNTAEIYRVLIEEICGEKIRILTVIPEEGEGFAVKGFLRLLEMEGKM